MLGQLGPIFSRLNLNLSFLAWFLFVTHLGDANPIHPLVQGPDVVAAQILDVLRLLLDLWMLQKKKKHTH